jgi:hypothetical protein
MLVGLKSSRRATIEARTLADVATPDAKAENPATAPLGQIGNKA